MTAFRNIRRNLASAAAALAVSAIFITAAAGPVSIPVDGPAAARNVA